MGQVEGGGRKERGKRTGRGGRKEGERETDR